MAHPLHILPDPRTTQEPLFIDHTGTNFTKAQVVEILRQMVGASDKVLDHVKVGGIYRNGGIIFQRMS